MLRLIREINLLWEPVYPYLSDHIREIYGREEGAVLDVGPFSGTVFALQKKQAGGSFAIACFPPGMTDFFRHERKARHMEGRIGLVEVEPSLACIADDSVDLVVFRGALFFPSFFHTDLAALYRILKAGGVACVGGGFGKYTPPSVIKSIGALSRELNLRIGKMQVSPDEIRREARGSGVEGHMEILSEGGLWALLRK